VNCQNCDEQLKKERGCFGEGTVPFYINTEQHYRCPIKLVSGISWEYIRAYGFYKNNFLPNGKGWLDESDRYLDAMSIIRNEITKMEAKKNKPKKRRGYRGRRP